MTAKRSKSLQADENHARQSANSFSATVQKLEEAEPDKGNEAKKARALASDSSDRLAKLKGEVEAEQHKAADLERQAQEARS